MSLATAALDPGVQAAIVTGAAAVAVALVGVLVELLRRQHKALGDVRTQVHNGHANNLRDDLDRLITGVDQLLDGQQQHADLLREHARDIGGLRQEIRHERGERRDVEQRLDDHLRDL